MKSDEKQHYQMTIEKEWVALNYIEQIQKFCLIQKDTCIIFYKILYKLITLLKKICL